MKLVILGCGRVGARLATLMDQDGHDVSIIDSEPASFNRLPESFGGQTVLGTGIDVDVLKSAGIEGADAFAAVTNGDNTNIMACQVAKEIFGVEKVLARIYDPGREGLYHDLGLETVCPTTLISTTVRNILLTDDGQQAPRLTENLPHDAGARPPLMHVPGSSTPVPLISTGAGQAPSVNGPERSDAEPQPARQLAPEHGDAGEDQDDVHKANNSRGLRGLFRP
jgi:trk system potassium uptake protein